MTADDLLAIFRKCAGANEGVILDGNALDLAFDELGYDSLALLEVTGHLQRDLGISLPDDVVQAAGTPRELLALVNDSR